ncbi:phycobilisome linker polypeptide [Dactylococcopsis salina]|uniref:CpcD/allophycocyanin linker domain protein n=1 Tax=Dactylococcopsis salina (strain PCC 8305) TaxID=13035 RepID=K9YQW3_DACS8|nr:phycobilisome linker polypeptide [Dactylococcopsis salina]AFZ49316.1 CpcD/allophycocyanin linker domain protein [Dactylococcopsis salina PCC 8305]
MYGQTTVTTPSSAASRMYRIEVEGMRQSSESDKQSYAIRKSGSVFFTVPYSRMNEQMRRINRMGGKIVSIEPLNTEPETESSEN